MHSTLLTLMAFAATVLAHPSVEQRDTRQFFGYTDLECAGGTIMTGPVTTGVCVAAPSAMISAQIFGPGFDNAEVRFFSDEGCGEEIGDVRRVGDEEASLCFDLGTEARSVIYVSDFALAANSHTAPVARAANITTSRGLGTLDDVHVEITRVLHNSRVKGLSDECVGGGVGDDHEAHEGDENGGELHVD
ncbi:hypothetical protein V494_05429 [Pseudogymnoascus sp. VKM F-4513 (FW-928)]|nr:hypothetical protein V494_05429 [Pseudogymnoascus sp. VKM F-4513 (FW-928)]